MDRISKWTAEACDYATLIAAYCLLWSVAGAHDPFALWRDLGAMLTGDVPGRTGGSFGWPQAAAFVVAELPATVALALAIRLFSGPTSSHHLYERFRKIQARTVGEALVPWIVAMTVTLAAAMFVGGVIEELLFRWLPGNWFGDPRGSTAYLLTLLAANVVFALLHYYNVDDRRERSLVQVAPAFLAGLWMTLIYAKHGLVAAMMCHALHNLTVIASDWCTYLRRSLASTR